MKQAAKIICILYCLESRIIETNMLAYFIVAEDIIIMSVLNEQVNDNLNR